MDNKLSAGIGLPRRIVGDVLLALILGFTVYLSVIMLGRIQTVVLKQVYRQVFRRELVVCGVFLIIVGLLMAFGQISNLMSVFS